MKLENAEAGGAPRHDMDRWNGSVKKKGPNAALKRAEPPSQNGVRGGFALFFRIFDIQQPVYADI